MESRAVPGGILMKFNVFVAALLCAALPAKAQDIPAGCAPLYAQFAAAHPIELAQCEPQNISYALTPCTPPPSAGPLTPASHLVLAIDASGSMAGRVGAETKMDVAKAAALAFLRDAHPDVAVGLLAFGHRGTNKEDGKAQSCAASEMLHGLGTDRAALSGSISALQPTGWTPMGGALTYAGQVIASLPPKTGETATTPVIYMISDGEETCGGDPVAAAAALQSGGVRTIVNTIGFDVDAVAEAQLQAIAAAGGGTYYPARDGTALRDQLRAIQQAEQALALYKYCTVLNAGKIGVAFHNETIRVTGCFARNNPQNRSVAIINAMNKAERDNLPEAACAAPLRQQALADMRTYGSWLTERTRPMNQQAQFLMEQYYISSGLQSLVPPK